jgi:hypothetical protein
MEQRISPGIIRTLQPNEIFVFGANQLGNHGKGAAKTAQQWGAKRGQGEGLMGQTYGIPTKGSDLRYSLPLREIRKAVIRFIEYARTRPELTFLVTEVGCGLAANTPEAIAPLFAEAGSVPNIHLPARFWAVLNAGK